MGYSHALPNTWSVQYIIILYRFSELTEKYYSSTLWSKTLYTYVHSFFFFFISFKQRLMALQEKREENNIVGILLTKKNIVRIHCIQWNSNIYINSSLIWVKLKLIFKIKFYIQILWIKKYIILKKNILKIVNLILY